MSHIIQYIFFFVQGFSLEKKKIWLGFTVVIINPYGPGATRLDKTNYNIDTGIPEKRETMGFLPTLQKDIIKSNKEFTNNSSYTVLYNALI